MTGISAVTPGSSAELVPPVAFELAQPFAAESRGVRHADRAGRLHLAGQLAVIIDVPGARADQDPQMHAQRVAAGQPRRKGDYLVAGRRCGASRRVPACPTGAMRRPRA